MRTVAWLPSYPKSGNTWMRIMLANYLTDEPVMPEKRLQFIVPDLHYLLERGWMMPLEDSRPLIIKSHFRPTAEINRLWASEFNKIVYLVRNPRDVIHSSMRHLHIREERRPRFARSFIESRGATKWLDAYGDWPTHVREWTDPEIIRQCFRKAELLTVRYEDLRADPKAWLQQIVEFLDLGEAVDADRVRRAVENAELEKLRAAEASFNQGKRLDYPFFGQGLQNQSLAVFGDDVEEAYRKLLRNDEEFARIALRFGYDG